MLKETLKFYNQFLPDIGFKINEEDALQKYMRNEKGVSYLPVKGEGLPVVLGTSTYLDSADNNNIIYHPLTEDALKGESFTIKITKNQMCAMLRMRFITTLLGFGTALVEKRNSKVSPKQTKLFNLNPDFDEKALAMLAKILQRGKASKVSRHVVGIYLQSKNAKFDGVPVKRLAKVTSPLYDALDNGEKEIWGVKNVSIKAQKAIKKLIDSILPGLNDDEYTHGSNSKTAPYFDALANAYLNVSYQLDAIDTPCKTLYHDELGLVPKYEWVDGLTKLAKLAMPIPPLHGNLGNEVIGQAAFDVNHDAAAKISEGTTVNADRTTTKVNAPTVATPATSPMIAPASSTKSEHPMFGGQQPTHVPQQAGIPIPARTMPQQHTGGHPFMSSGQQASGNTQVRNDDGLF